MKPKRIILIRHGESEANVNRYLFGSVPDYTIELTQKGRQQALEAGHRLKKLVGDESLYFYVSPFWRARSTFECLAAAFPRTDFAPEPEKSEEENLELFHKYVAAKEQQLSIGFDEQDLITEILISRGFMLTYKLELQTSFTDNTVYLTTDGAKESYICVENTLSDSSVTYFMQNTDTKFICIERAFNSTQKFNLKNRMHDKFFAF